MDAAIAAYAGQSRWSDPGPHAPALAPLGRTAASLPAALAGLLVHADLAESEGIAVPATARSDRQLRLVSDLIETLLERDEAPLHLPRPGERRAFVICRHFALLAAAVLRHHGIPARVRVGFASYFTPGFHEDHWICEHHDGLAWRKLDPELDARVCDRFHIAFPPEDVPLGAFLPAASMWRQIRCGAIAAEQVGLSTVGIHGAWFVAASMLRDLAALTMVEMLPWDQWGPARTWGPGSDVAHEWTARLDRLADALGSEPATLEAAIAVRDAFPWAALTATVASYPDGRPIEMSVG